MDNLKRKDLQDIITVTEHAEVIAEDVNLDLESREAALRTFVLKTPKTSLVYFMNCKIGEINRPLAKKPPAW